MQDNNQLFLTPQVERLTVTPKLQSQIAKYLATTYKVQISKKLAMELIPNSLQQWGQMRIKDGGNLIQAQGYHKLWWDGCNASFVQYELAIDQLAHCPRAMPEFKVKSFYSQLQHLFYLPLPPNTIINWEDYPKFLILAFILEANVTIEDAYKYQVIWYKGKLGSGEVVDAWTIQCAVGCIPDDNKDPTPGKVRPPGQKSNPGRLQESNPQVKVQSLSKIQPPRKLQGSNPQAKSNPGKSPTPEEDKDPNPTRDWTFTSAPQPSIPTSSRLRIPGHPTPRVGLSIAFGYTVPASKITKHTKTAGLYPRLVQAIELVDHLYQRQEETQHYLAKRGWTNEDISRLWTNVQLKSIWEEWVYWPKPPTNKDWEDIQSRLRLLLEGCSEWAHAKAREIGLSGKLSELLVKLLPPVSFRIRHRQSSMWDYASPSPYRPPFPLFIHMRNWMIVKDLWKTDCIGEEMLALFEEHSGAIEGLIVEWKHGIESYFANLVLDKKQSRVETPIVEPTMLRFGSKPDPLLHYTDEHKILLRGNVVFYNTKEDLSPPTPLTYSEIIHNNGLVALPLSLEPNSTLLTPELRHYIASTELFKKNLKAVRSFCGGVTYRNVHDTELCIEQSMVGHCSTNPPMELGGHTNKRCKCLLCAQIPGLEDVIAHEWAIVRHLQDVHGVAEGKIPLHYTPQHSYKSINNFGGYGLPPQDSELFQSP
ncbi:hypothetical protein RHS04_06704 [Rhizoctonia solani]|uniref:Uncharacterized protein n=1 Tax=Rhizoctonia solani TaxID=456999 RepID=A0A8H7H3A1_9AGAM|nr:hypothetical protein RHS04_06704 [Rhizoctonia solani]